MPADLFSLKSRNLSQYKKTIFNIDRNRFIDFAVNLKRFIFFSLNIFI